MAGRPDPAASDPSASRTHVRRAVLLWVVLTVLGIVFALLVPTRVFPFRASSEADRITTTFIAFTILGAAVAAVVWAVGAYSLWAFRAGSKERPETDGPPIRRNIRTEIAWITISSILTLVAIVWGLAALSSVSSAASPDAMIVNVTGQQWVWSYSYPDEHVNSPVLVLPVGREVVFRVTSKDVVHSFWIPSFGIKVDANPAEVTQTQTTPNVPGIYEVRCAELCGLYHSYMESQVKVLTKNGFDAWVKANGGRVQP
jgi:cytochrome c oxidase subunit 2